MLVLILNLLLASNLSLGQISSELGAAAPIRPKARPTSQQKDKNLSQISLSKTPQCFQSPSDLKHSKYPEAVIQKMFSQLSTQEIKTRLVFAEALASGKSCSQSNEMPGIIRGISWVIQNRFNDPNKRYGDGRGVVFKKYQFRSSFGSCDTAKRDTFLCPNKFPNWKNLWQMAKTSVKKAHHSQNNPMPNVRHYYLSQHFKNSKNCKKWDGVRPKWATKKARVQPDIQSLKTKSQCIEFYSIDN